MNNYKLLSYHESGKLQLTDITIDSTDQLKRFQEIVGGLIEIPYISEYLSSRRIDIIINEEGKLIDLPTTAIVIDGNQAVDEICGNVIFASNDDDGNTIGLTSGQMHFIENLQKHPMGLLIPVRNYRKDGK